MIWVSRATYQRVLDSLDASIGNEERLLVALSRSEDRYDALLEKYHALKVNGAVAEAPRPEMKEREPDAVQWAINQRAEQNPSLRKYLTGWAQSQRAAGVSNTELIERINQWSNGEDDD